MLRSIYKREGKMPCLIAIIMLIVTEIMAKETNDCKLNLVNDLSMLTATSLVSAEIH